MEDHTMNSTNITDTGNTEDFTWITTIGYPVLGGVILFTSTLFLIITMNLRKRFKNATWILVSWTLGELISTLGFFEEGTFESDQNHMNLTMTVIMVFPVWLTCAMATLSILDAYFAIIHSSRYEILVSKRRLGIYLFFLWIYSMLWSCLPFTWHKDVADLYHSHISILHEWYLFLLFLVHYLPGFILLIYIRVRVSRYMQYYQDNMHVTHTLAHQQLLVDIKTSNLVLNIATLYFLIWIPFYGTCFVGVFPLKDIEKTQLLCFFIGNLASVLKVIMLLMCSKHARDALTKVCAFKGRVEESQESLSQLSRHI